jgi:hypothetical protein
MIWKDSEGFGLVMQHLPKRGGAEVRTLAQFPPFVFSCYLHHVDWRRTVPLRICHCVRRPRGYVQVSYTRCA